GEALVGEVDVVLDAALAAKREAYAAAADVNVSVPERRQPERAVGARVLVVADANERLLEQLDDEREDLVARQARAPEILGRPPPDRRQRLREADHAVVLRVVANRAPARMIAVLLASARVAPR